MDIGVNLINRSSYKTAFQNTAEGPTRLQAVMALTQKFAKILLTDIGSDLYALPLNGVQVGSGLKALINRTDTNTSVASIQTEVTAYIRQTADFIRSNQERGILPDNERLLDAQLIDIYRDQSFEIVIRIAVTNVIGETFTTLIQEGRVVNFNYNN